MILRPSGLLSEKPPLQANQPSGGSMSRDIPEPDPEHPYPNIFDSRITRVRDHLALVIVDAPELLDRVLTIID